MIGEKTHTYFTFAKERGTEERGVASNSHILRREGRYYVHLKYLKY